MSVPGNQSILTVLNKAASGIAIPLREQMKYETLRLSTFQDYPPNKPFGISFAKAGFYYYGIGDDVVCYCCGLRVGEWQEDDIPMDIHVELSPNCAFFIEDGRDNVSVTGAASITTAVSLIDQEERPSEPPPADRKTIDSRQDDWFIVLDSASKSKKRVPSQSVIKHLRYTSYSVRLGSFTGFQCVQGRAEILAKAGFFYTGLGDGVKCFDCGLGLEDWDENDDPWTEHARYSNRCRFVREMKGEEFVNRVVDEDSGGLTNTSVSTTASPQQQFGRELVKEEEQEDDLVYLKSQSMKNNLIFTGVADADENETPDQTENKLKQHMIDNLHITEERVRSIEFEHVHRSASEPGRGITRNIIAKFKFFRDRENVRKQRKELNGTPYNILQHFPPDVEAKRRLLVPKMRNVRRQGKRSWIDYDTKYNDGIAVSVELPMMRGRYQSECERSDPYLKSVGLY